jgi:hypothetical protein
MSCTKKKLASTMLHEIVPKLFCNILLLRKAAFNEEPTCDDMRALWNKRFESRIHLNAFD